MTTTVIISPDNQIVQPETTTDTVVPAPLINTVVVTPAATTVVTEPQVTNVDVATTDLQVTVEPVQTTVVVSSSGGGGGGSDSNLVLLTNGWPTTVVLGSVIYQSSLDGIFRLAQANSASTSNALGLVAQPSIANGNIGLVQTAGTLSGMSGLIAGETYYVSDSSAGFLVTSPPTATGSFVVEVGVALSSTEMLIRCKLLVAL